MSRSNVRMFAVIQTVDSFGELEVSVVSQRWLSADGTCCLYPRMRNAAAKVIGHAKPDRETWQNIACTVLQSNIESHTEAEAECERRELAINAVPLEEHMSDADLEAEEDDGAQMSLLDETTGIIVAESPTTDEADCDQRVQILNVDCLGDIADPDYEAEEADFLDLATIESRVKTENECEDFEHFSSDPRRADADVELPIVGGKADHQPQEASIASNSNVDLAALNSKIDILMQKIDMLTAVVEAQSASHANWNRPISRDASIKLPTFPLQQVQQVERLNRQLRNEDFRRQMVLHLKPYMRAGSTNVMVSSLMREVLPDQLAVEYSWSGMSALNGVKSKNSFVDKLGLLQLIYETIAYATKKELLPKDLTRSVQDYFKRTSTRAMRSKQLLKGRRDANQ